MTTPRIGEMRDIIGKASGDIYYNQGITFKEISQVLVTVYEKAHQAGIDEERAKVTKIVREDDGRIIFNYERLLGYINDDTIEALQDNK